jgi:hypothetical protein
MVMDFSMGNLLARLVGEFLSTAGGSSMHQREFLRTSQLNSILVRLGSLEYLPALMRVGVVRPKKRTLTN